MNRMLQPLRYLLNDLDDLTTRLADLREAPKQDNVTLEAQKLVKQHWDESAAKIAKMVVPRAIQQQQTQDTNNPHE